MFFDFRLPLAAAACRCFHDTLMLLLPRLFRQRATRDARLRHTRVKSVTDEVATAKAMLRHYLSTTTSHVAAVSRRAAYCHTVAAVKRYCSQSVYRRISLRLYFFAMTEARYCYWQDMLPIFTVITRSISCHC